uniref:Dan protein n=1 Tax=Fopius arisanus TaxID=64838 RepID=A0A0C9QA39_9HYME
MRGESARPGKRPLRALSASEKMEAIQRVHEGESKASVARDIGVPESTLRGWCKSEQKIRGMARNSSTPDSEAHSPASSSGANQPLNLNNHSSEEEGPVVKRVKIDAAGSSYSSENSENDARMSEASRMEYFANLMTTMAGMRPENSALMLGHLGQLGLLSAANPLGKGLLNMPVLPHNAVHNAVGLVENGLQYTRRDASATKRHSTSAIAPAHMEAVKSYRKSLPPAAEAPHTPLPASPRNINESGTRDMTNEVQQQQQVQSQQHQPLPLSLPLPQQQSHQPQQPQPPQQSPQPQLTREQQLQQQREQRKANKEKDEALWGWLQQQKELLGPQTASVSVSKNLQDACWFWEWYTLFHGPTALPAPSTGASAPSGASGPSGASPNAAKKSPTKTRAHLDNVLCNNNNNNENLRHCFNRGEDRIEEKEMSSEEAIEHGEQFIRWLEKRSDPAVCRSKIIQLKYLIDTLKTHRKKTTAIEESRM